MIETIAGNKAAMVFITTPINKNSVAVLAGLIESDETLRDLSLLFLRDDDRLAGEFGRVLGQYERVTVACSFCTTGRGHVAHVLHKLFSVAAESDCAVTWLAGGPHPSGAAQDTLGLGFDIVVVGEAEGTLSPLLRCLLDGDDASGIRGLLFRRGDEFVYTGRAPWVTQLDDYPPFAPGHRRFGPIEITRGCPFACRFCQTSSLFGGRPRHRSPEVITEWARVARFRGIPFMRFIAPNALSYGSAEGREPNLAAVEALLRGVGTVMDKERIYLGSFPSEVRPETVTDEAMALIKRLAGNTNITIGAQSGSQRILEAMRRGHSVGDVYRACEIVGRHGLVPNVDVIFGLPGETRKDRDLTIRLIEDLSAAGARVRSHAFMPLAGTPLADAQPGAIDAETDSLLGRLARAGKHHGARRSVSDPARRNT